MFSGAGDARSAHGTPRALKSGRPLHLSVSQETYDDYCRRTCTACETQGEELADPAYTAHQQIVQIGARGFPATPTCTVNNPHLLAQRTLSTDPSYHRAPYPAAEQSFSSVGTSKLLHLPAPVPCECTPSGPLGLHRANVL